VACSFSLSCRAVFTRLDLRNRWGGAPILPAVGLAACSYLRPWDGLRKQKNKDAAQAAFIFVFLSLRAGRAPALSPCKSIELSGMCIPVNSMLCFVGLRSALPVALAGNFLR